jgi:iron complex outermembrane receptor protein
LSSLSYFRIDEELFGETSRKAKADGFEIDGSWVPNDNWDVSFSYAHVSTKVTQSSNPGNVGDPLPDEVPNKAAIWAKYKFLEGGLNGLSVGGGLIWTDDRVRPTAAAAQSVKKLNGRILYYEAETRLDLFAAYDWDNMQVSLNLRNLTEEANLSTTVPRVPLQGGVKPNGKPYVFDGDMEIMLGFRYFY